MIPVGKDTEGTPEQLEDRLAWLADEYFTQLDKKYKEKEEKLDKTQHWPDGYMHIKFAVKKGTTAPNMGLIYYMGFATVKLNFIHNAKQVEVTL